jgi:uroporphyrinogen decarboxylase
MNSRERFLTALTGGTPDRVPMLEFYWAPPFIRSVLGELKSPYHNADDEVAMSRATGIDMVFTAPYGLTSFASIHLHGEEYTDEWGTTWGTNETSWPGAWPVTEAVQSRADWEKLEIPELDLPLRMEQPARTVELADGDLAVLAGIRGPFSGVWMLAGLVNISLWIYDDPDFLHELFREMSRWYTQLGLRLVETGVDAISIHDDWGMNQATFIKPEHWREFVKPYITEEINTLAETGVPIILHSDGNLNVLMDEIAELNIAGLNPLQRSANMDLAKTKAKYGDRMALVGNLSCTTTLPYGTPDDVEREVLECLRDAGPGGGYILAPDHSFHSAISFENTWRALETCLSYGTYPLDLDAIEARIKELSQ